MLPISLDRTPLFSYSLTGEKTGKRSHPCFFVPVHRVDEGLEGLRAGKVLHAGDRRPSRLSFHQEVTL
jgi:hypothetical protein